MAVTRTSTPWRSARRRPAHSPGAAGAGATQGESPPYTAKVQVKQMENPLRRLALLPLQEGDVAWLWFGQGSFAFRFGTHATILVDPYLSDAIERTRDWHRLFAHRVRPEDVSLLGETRPGDTGVPGEARPGAPTGTALLLTHDHMDHFDEETVQQAVQEGMAVGGPASCRRHYDRLGLPGERFVPLNRGARWELGTVSVEAAPAHHSSGPDQVYDAVGYAFRYAGKTIYHVGDSEYTDEVALFARGLRPDLLTVPVNGILGNMGPADAAQMAQECGARAVVPMHFGLFAQRTVDPQGFVAAAIAIGLQARVHLPVPYQIETV